MMIRALFRWTVFVSVFALASGVRPGDAAPTTSAQGIETPHGTTRVLITPRGRRHVLVFQGTHWNGRRYQKNSSYQLVSNVRGELDFEALSTLRTPYGETKLVESDGRLSHQIKIGGASYEVTEKRNGSFVYTDGAGTSHAEVVRLGDRLQTPQGLTRPLMTAAGPRDVLVKREYGQMRYHLVSVVHGEPSYDEQSTLHTPFGETKLSVVDGRLSQRLTIGKRSYEVAESREGVLSYTDSEGHTFKHAPRVGTALLTPHGLTRSLMTPAGLRQVVKIPESERSGQVDESPYATVSTRNKELTYTPLKLLQTAYGPSHLALEQDALVHRIEIDGKSYSVGGTARARVYLDKQGNPYRDTWMARMSSAEARPIAIRSPYVKGLPALPEGTIAKIKDSGGSPTEHMSMATYDQLRDAMIETMRKYDPRTHYFIGLGSDPHPIIAFLDNLGGRDLAANFPASGKYNYGLAPSVLAPYVRRLIPPEVLNGSKTLVLLDQTNSGATRAGTLAQIAPVFEAYLKSIGSPAKVAQLAFSPVAQPKGTGHISTAKYPEIGKFLSYPYEHVVSQYARHVLNSNTPDQLIERPQYNQFRAAMMKRMKRDTTLDRFLVGELKLGSASER